VSYENNNQYTAASHYCHHQTLDEDGEVERNQHRRKLQR